MQRIGLGNTAVSDGALILDGRFQAMNDAPALENFAWQEIGVDDASDGSEDGYIEQSVMVDGAKTQRITADAAGVDIGGTLSVGGNPCIDDAGQVFSACLPTSTQEFQWVVPEALVVVGDISPQHLPNFQAGTVTTINCRTKEAGTTVDVNFDARGKTTPGTPGPDVDSAEIVADDNNTELTDPDGDTTIAENEELWLTISAISAPTELYCSVSVEAL